MKKPSMLVVGLVSLWVTGCSSNVASETQARQAYQGLDKMVEKALALGLAGYTSATNANIATQSGTGDASGTIAVDGKVAQGASDNREMDLTIELDNYSDGEVTITDQDPVEITYRTALADAGVTLPALSLSLRNIPNGTFTGSLNGSFEMAGDLTGTVVLALTLAGDLEDNGSGGPQRKTGTTTITGTATSFNVAFNVNLTR